MMREVIYVHNPKKVLYSLSISVLLKVFINTVAGDLSFPQSTGEEFILDFCQRALPFLKRVEKLHRGERKSLLEGYITTVAKVSMDP